MQSYSEHPSEDFLERFLLHQMEEEQLEGLESHILACHSCVTRLEELELDLAATKMALAELHQQTVAENYAAEIARQDKKSFWSRFVNARSLSLAGLAAAVALSITVAPRYTPVEKEMSAFRGVETNILPAGRPVMLHLNARDLPETAVSMEVVNADGTEIWSSQAKVDHQVVSAKLPPIDTKGNYLLRLYSPVGSPNPDSNRGELLREFAFDVQ